VLDGGIGRILRLPFGGGPAKPLTLPFDGTVDGLVVSTSTPGVFFESQTWVRAPALYRYDPKAGRVVDSGLLPPSQIDTSPYVSTEVQAKSADGAMVPLSIVYRKGVQLDGARPTWLSAYGSYGESFDPNFSPRRLAWLDRGGVYAVAHVRGGGEYGEEWHIAGMKKNKQNTIEDFIACARYLIEHKYTSPQHLGAEGNSAGGIAIGGAITKRPELFAAAIIRVGISDLLRFEETPGGPGNAIEFGSSKIANEFHDLYAASPYHHVMDGEPYPAVMLTGSAHDARVPLWEPAKMTARLQAATSSRKPVLLRVAYEAGHGGRAGTPTSLINAELADCYTFFYWQLSTESAQR
jgi:prolyl oligopeptidase